MSPCRTMLVVCASPDRGSLSDLKRAAVGAAWELAPGATTVEDALGQLKDPHAQVLVVQCPLCRTETSAPHGSVRLAAYSPYKRTPQAPTLPVPSYHVTFPSRYESASWKWTASHLERST